MAEINTGGGKKSSPRVDMTPMVDLGFLLVTFFMVTTTFSKPNVMELGMPDKTKVTPEEQTKVKASQAITLILGSDNRVFYYTGLGEDPANTKIEVGYFNDGEKSIRKALLRRKDEVAVSPSLTPEQRKNMVVLIKPDIKSNYKNVVDILDEMKICDIHVYAIVDLSKPEKEIIDELKVE